MKSAGYFLSGIALCATACTASAPADASASDRVEQSASPSPGDGAGLSRYVGKYPWDKVDGVDFLHDPVVRNAVKQSVTDPGLQKLLLVETEGATTGPIIESEGRLLMSAFDPASGGDVNWALLVAADGSAAALCHSTGVETGTHGAAWYQNGALRFTLDARCPHDAEGLQTLGTWPIGNIPG